MKVWITKYALTKGIEEADVELTSTADLVVERSSGALGCDQYYHGKGKEWHQTKIEAIQRAEEMRKKKIDSLRKQIEKLEKMTF